MNPVLNNTKWEELRWAMYGLGSLHPRWRAKDLSGYLSTWDGEWFYHFKNGGDETVEWVEIQVTSPAQDSAVLQVLREIHLPGHRIPEGFRVNGFAKDGMTLNYIDS